jgi:hypothetical protein
MGRVFSFHEYELKPGIDEEAFVQAVQRLRRQGLPALPGLTDFRLLHGIKGLRRGRFASLWTYESRQAWEQLWGPPEQPVPPSAYPSSWRSWEEGIGPFLDPEPDRIAFTVYEEIGQR